MRGSCALLLAACGCSCGWTVPPTTARPAPQRLPSAPSGAVPTAVRCFRARSRPVVAVAPTGDKTPRAAGKDKRAARPPSGEAESEPDPVDAATAERPAHDEPCNVVLTHTNTDFDSLAGAVALAKLWSFERPELPTHVVLPRGVNPLVARFIAYHKHLLPLRGFQTINPSDLHAVGVVDTQSRERLGPAEAWLAHASHVAVYDHHLDASGDISPDELILEPVGSATTVLVERLRRHIEASQTEQGSQIEQGGAREAGGTETDVSRESSPTLKEKDASGEAGPALQEKATGAAGPALQENATPGPALQENTEGPVRWHGGLLTLSQAEATLFALGIRADTGALSYADTTPRDGHALVWLMERGASQHAIAEFGHTRLSAAQRDVLSHALFTTSRSVHEGLKLGTVHLDSGRGFMGGMAAVAEELISLMGLDVVLMAVTHQNTKDQVFISLIGRASVRAKTVDLNAVMRHWSGGGHPAAAAASFRLQSKGDDAIAEARAALEEAHGIVLSQVPKQVTAADLMTTRVFACSPDETMDDARAFMLRVDRKAAPVVDGGGKLLGMLKYRDVMKAAQAAKGSQLVKGWMRRDTLTVPPDTPLDELEEILLEQSTGRLPVVSEDGRLLGLVTRTDVLRQRKLYSE